MLTAIYDGQCVLCRQTRAMVRVLDWLHRVEFLDLHEGEAWARYPNLDYEAVMGAMHVVDKNGIMLAGFPGVRRILKELPLGFPLWLIMQLPGMNWLGNKVYGFIAKHRYTINRLVGAPVCENGVCKVHTG